MALPIWEFATFAFTATSPLDARNARDLRDLPLTPHTSTAGAQEQSQCITDASGQSQTRFTPMSTAAFNELPLYIVADVSHGASCQAQVLLRCDCLDACKRATEH